MTFRFTAKSSSRNQWFTKHGRMSGYRTPVQLGMQMGGTPPWLRSYIQHWFGFFPPTNCRKENSFLSPPSVCWQNIGVKRAFPNWSRKKYLKHIRCEWNFIWPSRWRKVVFYSNKITKWYWYYPVSCQKYYFLRISGTILVVGFPLKRICKFDIDTLPTESTKNMFYRLFADRPVKWVPSHDKNAYVYEDFFSWWRDLLTVYKWLA